MARLAGIAEFWLDKPVLAINTATYWWARCGRTAPEDKVDGFGSLLLEYIEPLHSLPSLARRAQRAEYLACDHPRDWDCFVALLLAMT